MTISISSWRLAVLAAVAALALACSSDQSTPPQSTDAPANSLAEQADFTEAPTESARQMDLVGPDSTDTAAAILTPNTPTGMARVLSTELAAIDPGRAGWNSERIAEQIDQQLKRLTKIFESGGVGDASLEVVATSSLQTTQLTPEQSVVVYDVPPFAVRRWESSEPLRVPPEPHGAGRLAAVVRQWLELLGGQKRRLAIKVLRVTPGEELGTTDSTLYVEAVAEQEDRTVQHTALWECEWRRKRASSAPQMSRLRLTAWEEASCRGRFFEDCTRSALGAADGAAAQLARSSQYWARRLPMAAGIDSTAHSGLAIGDVNGDGWDDVYRCEAGGLPNMLFVRQSDGTVVESAAAAGLDILDHTRAALLVDFDNDQDQDLFLALESGVALFRHQADDRFVFAGAVAASGVHSLAAADFDNDGLVDVYACRYPDSTPIPYHDANNGAENLMLKNLGEGRFEDVADRVGLGANNRRFSFAAAWEDYDNDGDQDLYVANDYGRNNLYRNDGGTFRDVAELAGSEDVAAGMSVSWGDYNRDGFMDLYVGNMFSTAGSRVTGEGRFQRHATDDVRALYRRHARGNTLFAGGPRGDFDDVSEAAAVTMGRWAWSSQFADLNNDGWDDLLVANGYLTNEQTDDL